MIVSAYLDNTLQLFKTYAFTFINQEKKNQHNFDIATSIVSESSAQYVTICLEAVILAAGNRVKSSI